MQQTIVIKLNQDTISNPLDECHVEWGVYNQVSLTFGPVESSVRDIHAILQLPKDQALNVLTMVPAEAITNTLIDPPAKKANLVAKAVPFALEDTLADDVENMHFVSDIIKQKQKVYVQIIDRLLLEHWLEVFKQCHLNPLTMTSDAACLPDVEHDGFLYLKSSRGLIKLNRHQSVSCRTSQSKFFLQTLMNEADEFKALPNASNDDQIADPSHPDQDSHDQHHDQGADKSETLSTKQPDQRMQTRLVFLNEKNDKDAAKKLELLKADARALYPHLKIVRKHLPASGFDILARTLINQHKQRKVQTLLTGIYKPKSVKTYSFDKRWLGLAAAVVIAFVLQVSLFIVEGYHYKQQSQQFNAASVDFYRQVFPNARNTFQMKKNMAGLISGGDTAQSSATFLSLLSHTGQALSQFKRLEIQRMTFNQDKGQFEINLRLETFDQVDQLKNALNQSGMVAEVSGATKDKDKVRARVVVRPIA